MENYKAFTTTLFRLLNDLNRYSPDDNLSEILNSFDKFDIPKMIGSINKILKSNEQKVKSKDSTIFNTNFFIFPMVDLSVKWPSLIKGQRDKMWTYLNILMLTSDIILESNVESFNPYLGVGTNDEMGVNELIEDLEKIPDESGLSMEAIMKMTGLDKMIDFNVISEKLRSMKDVDFERFTDDNIATFLDDQATDKDKLIFSSMIKIMREELQEKEIGKNPLKDIEMISKSMTEKFAPIASENNLGMQDMMSVANSFMRNMKDENGNPVNLNEGPLGMLNNMMNKFATQKVNPEECKRDCDKMMKEIGLSMAPRGRGGPSRRGRR